MADPFSGKRELLLRAYDGNEYVLHRRTWDFKLSKPERAHLQHNFDKIVATLAQPDEARESLVVKSCFVAYKQFESYWVRPGIRAPNPPGLKWFAVVADKEMNVVKTFYPCRKPKPGRKIWP